MEHRSYNRIFKISSTFLTPPPPLKLSPKTQKNEHIGNFNFKTLGSLCFFSFRPSFLQLSPKIQKMSVVVNHPLKRTIGCFFVHFGKVFLQPFKIFLIISYFPPFGVKQAVDYMTGQLWGLDLE